MFRQSINCKFFFIFVDAPIILKIYLTYLLFMSIIYINLLSFFRSINNLHIKNFLNSLLGFEKFSKNNT